MWALLAEWYGGCDRQHSNVSTGIRVFGFYEYSEYNAYHLKLIH